MRKFFKIIGITLASVVGLVIVVAAVVVWCVFTPERVTPVVRNIADRYITCEWDMGNVELTFFSTFPEFGLHIDGLYLVNPMQGAQSDTVLVAPSVVAKLNVMAFLQHKNLIIRELSLPNMTGNIYLNPQGESNLAVFYTSPDTLEQDTAAFSLPFDSIVVNRCVIEAQSLTFLDAKDTIATSVNDAQISLNMAYWDDIHVKAQLKVESVQLKGEEYAHDVTLRMDIPAELDLNTMYIRLKDARLAINEFELGIDGDMTIADTIPMNVALSVSKWPIQPLLALLPPSLASSLKDVDADGLLSLDATAQGLYAEHSMPLVDARVRIDKGQGAYAALPYTFTHLSLDAKAHVDLNHPKLTQLTINQLRATTRESQIALKGTIHDLMNTMQTTAHINLDASLPDWTYFLPDSLLLGGRVKGELDLTATISELTAERLNSIAAKGSLEFSHLDVQMDSLRAQLNQGVITMDAHLKDWPVINADISLQSNERLTVTADSLDARIESPKLTAHAVYDTKDTTRIPTFNTTLAWKELDGYFKDYKGHIGGSQLEAKMTNSRRNQSVPVFSATLASQDIDAYAQTNHLTTQSIHIEAKGIYRKGQDNILLTWNPRLQFALNGAEADLEGFSQHVTIPQILFKYSNREFDIIRSNLILGKSDFALSGQIYNIGKWLMKKEILSGELNFVSNHTDVDELMTLFSADTGSEETTTTTTTKTTTTTTTTTDTSDSGPFLVPTDVDLTLTTQIKEAVAFDQVAHNLGGKVYVKDGTLVLEEMGFVCDAAKLQLTAMYRTPRRNHLYLGLDYHMLDIKIDQLISMIPQIDSMVPMLKSFKGEAEFHIAGETYLKENYQIKTSTLRGACSIFGKDLVVMDSETFDKISKILSFKKKTVNKVDSISAEMTLYKNEVDVYPFCVAIDNYMAALGGRHNLDMSFDYHINLLSPIYLGVDVTGTMDNLSIKPAKCIYAKDFKPLFHNQVDTQNAELRQIIRNSLRKNVKIQ